MDMASEKNTEETGRRKVLDWIGYKKDEVLAAPMTPEEMLSKIQKQQEEIAALRAQKDFHELDSQELEALASETAVTILATVHKREADAKKAAGAAIAAAEKKAEQIVAKAESSAAELHLAAEKKLKEAKDSNDLAVAIRKEIADSLAVARANHIAAADTQDKARQAAEKAYNTIIASIEDFDNHAKKIHQDLKPATEK